MYWHEYPVVRLIIPFSAAVIIKYSLPNLHLNIYLISSIVLVLSVFLAFFIKKFLDYKKRFITGLIVNIIFFLLGFIITDFHQNRFNKKALDSKLAKADYLVLEINDFPTETEKSIKINSKIVQIVDSNNVKTSIKAKLINYLKKDSISKSLKFGDILLIKNNLEEVDSPSNPKEFNYKSYLAKKHIYYSSYLRSEDYSIIERANDKFSLRKLSNSLRERVLSNIQKKGIEGDEYSVAAALLLGQKDYLSPELRQTYAGVGAMHVLCVSGLHVGIIFMIIQLLLKNLDRRKHGRKIRLILILLSIWFYALITGLSPSVLRASTMFSFIALGSNINRRIHIYNSISASALLLMIINPLIIFQLGFQLSYMAVIAIVSLQPHLYNLIFVRNKILDKIWALITVSISAQIGTFPISLFYFNQFPNYFILTNLIVIPAAFIVIYTGISFIITSFIPILSDLIASLLSFELKFLNYTLTIVENLPAAVSENIYINSFQMIAFYLLIFLIGIMIIHKKRKLIYLNLIIIFSLIFSFSIDKLRVLQNDEILIYSTNNGLAISDFNSKSHTLYIDSITKHNFESFMFSSKNYWIYKKAPEPRIELKANNTNNLAEIIDNRVFRIKDKKFVIFDKNLEKLKSKSELNTDYFIINENYLEINKEILELYNPKNIVLNSYLNKNQRNFLEEYSNTHNLKIYNLKEDYIRIADFKEQKTYLAGLF